MVLARSIAPPLFKRNGCKLSPCDIRRIARLINVSSNVKALENGGYFFGSPNIEPALERAVELLNQYRFVTCGIFSGVRIGDNFVIIFDNQYHIYTQKSGSCLLVYNPSAFVVVKPKASVKRFDLENIGRTFLIVKRRYKQKHYELFCKTVVAAINVVANEQ